MTGPMDFGSKLAAVPVTSATRTLGIRLSCTSCAGMAPSVSMIWSLASTPSPGEIAVLLAELDGPEDDEHPDVWIDHESGWGLSSFSSGLPVWENSEAAHWNLAICCAGTPTRHRPRFLPV